MNTLIIIQAAIAIPTIAAGIYITITGKDIIVKLPRKLFIISAVALAALTTSCTKEETIIPQTQEVTYTISCDYCLAYIEDDVWNRYNELDRSKNQHFNVNGSFKYTFTNTGLDTAIVRIYVSSMTGNAQVVKVNIWDNQGRSARSIDTLGFALFKDYKNESITKMALR